ncbi:MAG: sialate O-acetylesterase [Bacilli bacterium]|jgi:hypothetical protein|nr:sialate O-acetylesterase [Candidatus Methanomethylophilaceae archaeon]MDD3841473.1 sialate O-acetylesterase [Bacilli bacterium]
MKRKKLMLLTAMCVGLMGCNNNNRTPIDVIIMGGQSNMVGCSPALQVASEIGNDKYNEYIEGYPEIKIAYDCWTKLDEGGYYKQNSSNNNFVTTMFGQGNSTSNFGPEMGMAEYFSKHGRNNKVALIKHATGAASLYWDFASTSSQLERTVYANFIKYIKDACESLKRQGYEPTIKAFCWMQGEGDAFPTIYAGYEGLTELLIQDVRNDLKAYEGKTEMAFIDATISDSTRWVYYQQINTAKRNVSEEAENNILIDALSEGLDKTSLQEDEAHYRGSAMVQLGQLFAEAVEPFLTPIEL